MPLESLPAADSHTWVYREVATSPGPPLIEDHFLAALRSVTASLDVSTISEAVLIGLENAFAAASSWIMLHDPRTNTLRTVLSRGQSADVYRTVEVLADCGVTGRAFTRAEIQFVPDASTEGGWFDPGRVQHSGLRSVWVLPLIAGDDKLGVLGVDSPRLDRSAESLERDVTRLEIFAAQAAIGLQHARLYEASQRDRQRLRTLLRERRALRQQVVELREEVRDTCSLGPIVAGTETMRAMLSEIEQVAGSGVTVLLLGETGTGKELLACAIHNLSERGARPFVAVNCAALPEHLVESEMFGHERGAFTGAHMRKPGRFELAHRGTLFLDEIGDLPLNAQAKLLRVLQDGEVHRVGGTQGVLVDVRLVAATNQDLSARVTERAFRDDLFYRLSVFPIRVPALRERLEDIPLLVNHFVVRSAQRLGKRITGIEQDVFEILCAYPGPAMFVSSRTSSNERCSSPDTARFPLQASGWSVYRCRRRLRRRALQPPARWRHRRRSSVIFADAERRAILDSLRRADGRVSGKGGAAALLGLRPTTLHAKMKKLGVSRRDIIVR